MSKMKVVICPYCGDTQPAGDRCRHCSGLFEALSRQATHNAMGPWFVRNENRPFQPGCSYETLIKMIETGRIEKYSIIRGPTTKQFWTIAKHAAGVAHLLGYCHACDARVDKSDIGCASCGAPFGAYLDRNHLGLPDVQPLEWDDDPGDSTAGDWGNTTTATTPTHRPTPQATGISSFARDDEIASSPTPPKAPHSDSLATHSSRQHQRIQQSHWPGEESSSTATVPAPSQRSSSPSAASAMTSTDESYHIAKNRTLERRLRRQQTMITALFVAMLVLLAIATAAAFGLFSSDSTETVDSTDQTSSVYEDRVPADSDSDKAGSASHDAPSPPDKSDSSSTTEVTGDDNTIADTNYRTVAGGASEQSNDQQLDQDQQSTDTLADAEFAEAERLISEAANSDMALDERIALLKQAVQQLHDIRDQHPETDWPRTLDSRITQAERELKRLELKKYFPD